MEGEITWMCMNKLHVCVPHRTHVVLLSFNSCAFRFFFLQGINLVTELIDTYGLGVVQAYMGYIQVRESIMYKYLCKQY